LIIGISLVRKKWAEREEKKDEEYSCLMEEIYKINHGR
jgi:hypothetical protein